MKVLIGSPLLMTRFLAAQIGGKSEPARQHTVISWLFDNTTEAMKGHPRSRESTVDSAPRIRPMMFDRTVILVVRNTRFFS